MKRTLQSLAAALALAVGLTSSASALNGPNKVVTGSYKFEARSEPLVATDRMVDLWAEVYRPATVSKKSPLLIFLHGNHGTCGYYDTAAGVRIDNRADYTTTGACPEGYVVTPNHLGYAYLAEELASWGYVVVSINANRGITAGAGIPDVDRGLNLMRGRLILRHLALLSDWNRGKGDLPPPESLGFDPKGKLDFSQVGMMGHSRGGEGVRAALQQYRDEGSPFSPLIEPMTIRSLFEIGPVDGQTGRVLDADGVNSMILLPGCDGDVYNLQGMKVFDRVFSRAMKDKVEAFHGTFHVWGANHNAYNTEWLASDSDGCRGSNQIFPANGRSLPQQETAFKMLVPFFRATVGPKPVTELAARFDPAVDLPQSLLQITRYERGYLPGPVGKQVKLLESFTSEGEGSDDGVAFITVGVDVVKQPASYEHDPSVRVATVSWAPGESDTRYFQLNFGADGEDLSKFKTLAFRTALRCYAKICEKLPSKNGEMKYTVALVGKKGKLSEEVPTTSILRISRPAGPNFGAFTDSPDDYLHSTLYTVEIPLEAFAGVDLAEVKGVRFTFENRSRGVVDIGAVTASTVAAGSGGEAKALVAAVSDAVSAAAPAKAAPSAQADGNSIRIVRASASGAKADARGAAPAVEIVLSSKRSFPITGALPRLTVGSDVVEGGDVSADGKTMTVSVPTATYDKLEKGAAVTLFLQTSSAPWSFGALPN